MVKRDNNVHNVLETLFSTHAHIYIVGRNVGVAAATQA